MNNKNTEPTNSPTTFSPKFIDNFIKIHKEIVANSKKEWEKEIDNAKKEDSVTTRFTKDPRG